MTDAPGRVSEGFRAQPPDVGGPHFIDRPRLMEVLVQRFDRRLTLMTAVAGAGKTSTLALAMEANRMQRRGIDVFIAANDKDRTPGVLLDAIAQALGAPLEVDTIASVADAVWARAPEEVAIIVDDAHVIIGSPAEPELIELLDRLPNNGHLVLTGRRVPAIALARRRSQGEVVEIGNDDSLLTDDELGRLVARHALDTREDRDVIDVADVPRVVGLADLTLRFGQSVGADFIWEEVLAALEPCRLESLRLVSMFDEFDDNVVRTVTGGSEGVEALVESLPLVDRDAAGTYRFHSLLRNALSADLSPEHLDALRCAAAAHADAVGDRALAVRLLSSAGETDRAMSTARAFILGSSLRRTFGQLSTVRDAVVGVAPDSALVLVLEAELRLGQFSRATSHEDVVVDLLRAAELARVEGDRQVEAVALFRSIQQSTQHGGAPDPASVERLGELAEDVAYAAQVVRYARAGAALGSHGSEAAVAEMEPLEDPWDPISEQVYRAGFLCMLGRFEDVAAELTLEQGQSVAPAAVAYHQYATYFRGAGTPELALAVHNASSYGISASRIVSPEVVTCSVLALMGVQSDDRDNAEAALTRAEAAAAWGCAPSVRGHIDASRAAAAMTFDSEAAAAEAVAGLNALVPLDTWPSAAHLTVLELVYLLAPEARAPLDRCRFGVAKTVAIDAARAVIEVRKTGTSALLPSFPWDNHALMRVQVVPPLLVELAASAVADDVGGAREFLMTVPGAERHLRRIAASATAAAPHAAALLSDWPTPPSISVRVDVLGPLVVWRDGEVLRHPDFDRRARVQELLAALVEHRRLARTRLCELLWPDLDPKKAAGNLRVTLAYLNRALEPERSDGVPFCIRAEGDALELHESIGSDLEDFDRAIRRATTYDRSGAPRAALDWYRSAVGLWRGDVLEAMSGEWIEATRERVRFAVVNAMLRIGELTLARGEPEEALEWAIRVRSLATLHDRAERLNASCRLATGDRAGAVQTLRALADGLAELGLRLEVDTERQLARLTGAR